MPEHNIYEPTQDARSDATLNQPPPFPNEPYYQAAPVHGAGRRLVGGVLLTIGVLWLVGMLAGGSMWFTRGSVGGDGMLFDRTYNATQLEMDVTNGTVEVRPWNEQRIRVEARHRGGAASDYNVQVIPDRSTLRISGGSKPCLFFCSARNVEYTISMPSNGNAHVKTVNGMIDVAQLSGQVQLESTNGAIKVAQIANGLDVSTTNGRIDLDEIGGELRAHSINGAITLDDGRLSGARVDTTNGQIDLSGVSGEVDVRSVNGKIEVRDASNVRLNVSTTSGDVEYAGSLAREQTHTINTVSGDVALHLPSDSAFDLRADTVSGDISSDFELAQREEGRRNLSGTVGGGGSTLKITTTNGDIQIERE